MSRVAPQAHEPVELTKRRYMSSDEKLIRWRAVGGLCRWCGMAVAPFSDVIWDHRIALALGGTNGLSNMEPLHVDCSAEKTRADMKAIAKAKRLARKNADPETRALEKPKRPIHNKGFDPSRTRGLNGKVRMK